MGRSRVNEEELLVFFGHIDMKFLHVHVVQLAGKVGEFLYVIHVSVVYVATIFLSRSEIGFAPNHRHSL